MTYDELNVLHSWSAKINVVQPGDGHASSQ